VRNRPLMKNPTRIDKSKYYRFYKSLRRDRNDSFILKDAIEEMIRKCKLRRFTKEESSVNNKKKCSKNYILEYLNISFLILCLG